jgi:hypothetical protein
MLAYPSPDPTDRPPLRPAQRREPSKGTLAHTKRGKVRKGGNVG